MNKAILFLFLVFLISLPLSADFSGMNCGTRPMGMGNAFSAMDGAPESIYFNPAGIAGLDHYNLNTSYQNVYGISDLVNLNLAVTAPLGDYTAGLAVQQVNLLDVYNENILYLDVARQLRRGNSHFKLGVSGKYFLIGGSEADVELDMPYDFDLGFVWQTKGFALSSCSKNILRFASDKDNISSVQVLGAAVNWQELLNMTADYEIESDRGILHLGIELWFYDTFAPRIGLDDQYLTMGFGLKSSLWDFDFGLKTHEKLGTTYRFGFNLKYKRDSL
ncbi:MAG: hypothetical protein K9N06_02870 [Candidatus Cloacimonetes bacterium]|nr:hypothetical protein [Candidatus Cloacimonadota bacterium]